MKKGISPIVAAVLLIAITMAIAGILSFWAGSFVQRNIEEGENTTSELSCLNARFQVFSTCSYYPINKEITVVLENQGSQDLVLDSLYVFYPNNFLKQFKLSGKLPGNQLIPFNSTAFNVVGIDPGFQSFQLRTTCPNVYRDFNCTEVR